MGDKADLILLTGSPLLSDAAVIGILIILGVMAVVLFLIDRAKR